MTDLGYGRCEFGRFNPPLSWLSPFHKLQCFAKHTKISARLLIHKECVTQQAVHGPDK